MLLSRAKRDGTTGMCQCQPFWKCIFYPTLVPTIDSVCPKTWVQFFRRVSLYLFWYGSGDSAERLQLTMYSAATPLYGSIALPSRGGKGPPPSMHTLAYAARPSRSPSLAGVRVTGKRRGGYVAGCGFEGHRCRCHLVWLGAAVRAINIAPSIVLMAESTVPSPTRRHQRR